jgi:YggT family protein
MPRDIQEARMLLVQFIEVIILALTVLRWIIIIQAILSWLVAFNVINTSNGFVRGLLNALTRMTEPLYRPIRRILPDFGGIDFSPLVVLLIIIAIQMLLRGLEADIVRAYLG